MKFIIALIAIISVAAAQLCETCDLPIYSLQNTFDVCGAGGIYNYHVGDFNLIALGYSPAVSGDIRAIGGGDVEGRVLAAGDLFLLNNGYSIGDKIVNFPDNAPYTAKAYSAIVGGTVTWGNGQLNPVNNDSSHVTENGVYYGGIFAPDYLRFSQCTGNPLDLTDIREEIQALATDLATQPATASYSVLNNGQTIALSGAGVGVCNYLLRINASDWNAHKDFLILPSWNIAANVIIDIVCDAADPIVFLNGEFPGLASNILYNFGPGCQDEEIAAQSVTGSILAPWSVLNQADGRIWGNVIVGRVSNFLQINEVPCPPNPDVCDCCNLCSATPKKGSLKSCTNLGKKH